MEKLTSIGGKITMVDIEPMYESVCEYVKTHQGPKGYIDCQPYQKNADDTIYSFEFDEEKKAGIEMMVYGVRWNEKEHDLEICSEPYSPRNHIIYTADVFTGTCVEEEANAEWKSVKHSDQVYYVPTLFNIAEDIEEYGEDNDVPESEENDEDA